MIRTLIGLTLLAAMPAAAQDVRTESGPVHGVSAEGVIAFK